MKVPSAETNFNEGLAALADHRNLVAADLFLAAMHIEAQHRVRNPDMRYLSYYGLSLARARRAAHAAAMACELAVRSEPRQPALFLNLGHVYLLSGRTSQAIHCFERGLDLAPAHESLLRELSRADRRSPPMIRPLSRSNPMNEWGGKLKALITRRVAGWLAGPRSRVP